MMNPKNSAVNVVEERGIGTSSACNIVLNKPLSLLATTYFRVKIGAGLSRPLRAICDSGAQVNLISDLTIKELGISPHESKANILGIGGERLFTRGTVVLELWHRWAEVKRGDAVFVVSTTPLPIQPLERIDDKWFPRIPGQELADPYYNEPNSIDALLGVGIWTRQLRENIIASPVGLIAQNTEFGWVIFGEDSSRLASSSGQEESNIGLVVDKLPQLIQKLWEMDEMPEKRPLSVEDQYCLDNFKSTVVRKGGRYEVVIPIRPNMELGESRATALRRLYCLENRFKQNPGYREKYVEFMREYERLGHMKRVGTMRPGALHYYIPHHAVAIEHKFRVVFDGSAKSTNGLSLNDIQFAGPKLQRDLMDIVMTFRMGRIAMSADIVKMFRQVAIRPQHWNLQRIVWRENRSDPIMDFCLTVITYGLASSPFNAVMALWQCAEDFFDQFPIAAQSVKEDFYMDDWLKSVHSENEAVVLKGDMIKLLNQGGFELAKWRSNCSKLADTRLNAKNVSEPTNTSVLGVVWDFTADEFQFRVRVEEMMGPLTKRKITSMAARVFDPQGYVSPVTIRAKLFIQKLWQLNKNWDEPLSEPLQGEWKSFYGELELINQVKIPRWLGTFPHAKIQIHAFCDASSKAFGVVVYIRVFENDQWKSELLCSKSRVAPIKLITIPRLELCAVSLGCKLLSQVKRISMLQGVPVFLWTDSEIVLHWIRKPMGQLKLFVANRVSKILETIEIRDLRHIRSGENPADLISRGIGTKTIIKNNLWWHGPQMLKELQEKWPEWSYNIEMINEHQNMEVEAECKSPAQKFDNVLLTTITPQNEVIDLMEIKSSYRSVCRITAFVFRFLRLCYGPLRKKRGICHSIDLCCIPDKLLQSEVVVKVGSGVQKVATISVLEFNMALSYWIKVAQRQCFPTEYKSILEGKAISNNSRLWSLTPVMDKNGIMRIYGRLNNSDLNFDQKRPIILDYHCTLARRLAEEAHRVLGHGGAQACTQFLRNKYWILKSRILTRKVVRSCVICCRYRQEAANQFMADLPAMRLKPMPPFYHTGIDFAGPISLKQSRNVTTKGYIAVFVCMVYKAVHLELVGGLDSRAFIAAMTRFVNLRAGNVHHMYSDNGRNFIGADRILREAVQSWQNSEVVNYLQVQSIQWHFNVPNAPHHGGLWEAAVKSTKFHLKRMGGAHLFTFEELATLLAKIAACLNSRPLTPISNDPTDVQTLTPGHFLTGQTVMSPYEELLREDVPMNRLTAWERIQKLQQEYWNRWTQEYIGEQQRRNKWAGCNRSLQIGDLVFIKNEITPPGQWLMGRVIEVYTGKDGKVRSCKLKTAVNELSRPITQLCLLPQEDESNARASDVGFPQFP